jgi:hypothetical protein
MMRNVIAAFIVVVIYTLVMVLAGSIGKSRRANDECIASGGVMVLADDTRDYTCVSQAAVIDLNPPR